MLGLVMKCLNFLTHAISNIIHIFTNLSIAKLTVSRPSFLVFRLPSLVFRLSPFLSGVPSNIQPHTTNNKGGHTGPPLRRSYTFYAPNDKHFIGADLCVRPRCSLYAFAQCKRATGVAPTTHLNIHSRKTCLNVQKKVDICRHSCYNVSIAVQCAVNRCEPSEADGQTKLSGTIMEVFQKMKRKLFATFVILKSVGELIMIRLATRTKSKRHKGLRILPPHCFNRIGCSG